MKRYIITALCIFLTGCSSHKIEHENAVTIESTDISKESIGAESASEQSETMTMKETMDSESTSDIKPDHYSGEWISWNNADSESGGGVSLTVTVSGQSMDAKLSAWAPNYNRLADADLSGLIQDHKVSCYFDDDGRGHAGEVQLTLKNNTIQMEVKLDKDTENGDFSFPEGTTILHRKGTKNSAVQSESKPIESDNAFPLSVYSDDGSADFYVSFNDTYEALKKRVEDSAAAGGSDNWEEYTEYTVLNKKDKWPLIHDEDEYMKYASIMYTMIEPSRKNTLIFITEDKSAPLCYAFTGSPDVMSEKGIKCGDSLDDIEKLYGKGYGYWTTGKKLICEYKTLNGYLRFLLNPENKTVTEWGIDKYSFEDRTNAPNE